MNISLPADMKAFVEALVAERGYSTSSEFIRELIRREQDREALRAMVLEGLGSGQPDAADQAYFAELDAYIDGLGEG